MTLPARLPLAAGSGRSSDLQSLERAAVIGALVGRKPAPWKRRKGVVYYHDVSLIKHLSRHYDEPTGDVMDHNRAWQLFARYAREVLEQGYTLIMRDTLSEAGRYPLLLFPTADKYAVMAAVGTNGINYGLDNDAVIRWFLELEKTRPFYLVDAGHDFVDGRFTGPIADPHALVERMLKFCPDVRNFADADNRPWTDEEVAAALVRDLQEGGGSPSGGIDRRHQRQFAASKRRMSSGILNGTQRENAMSASSVPISEASHQLLNELAQQTGQTVMDVLDKALDAYRRKLFLEQLNAGYAELRADPEAWAEHLAERGLWEATLMDGLDPAERWTEDGRCPTPEEGKP